MPTLEWLRNEFKDTVNSGDDCVVESPLSSAMWQQSPISECFAVDGPAAKLQVEHQCLWNRGLPGHQAPKGGRFNISIGGPPIPPESLCNRGVA